MYVRPVDPSGKGAPSGGPWQVSTEGGLGMGFWRQDGKEFYYLAADRGFMAVDVSLSPSFEFGKPRLLFRLPEALDVAVGTVSVSRDGERFVVAAPAAAEAAAAHRIRPPGKDPQQSRGARQLCPGQSVARRRPHRGDAHRSQDESERYLDVTRFPQARGTRLQTTTIHKMRRSGRPTASRWLMFPRRKEASLQSTGRPGTAAETRNSYSPIRPALGWFSPTGLRTGSSWPFGPKSS